MQLSENDSFLENSQKIYFDDAGKIVFSCDSIFPANDILNKNIRIYFPLIDSIFDIILSLKINDPEIKIQKIDTVFPKLNGLYDFLFWKSFLNDEKLNLLVINDYTKFYNQLRRDMQNNNEDHL